MSRRKFTPSPAMLVACFALFVALGGSALAVTAATNSVKSSSIKSHAILTRHFKSSAKAPNAAKLNGISPSGYQKFCGAGALKGSMVLVNPTGLPADNSYEVRAGFDCGGGVVRARKTGATGEYEINFSGGAGGTEAAVVSTDSHADAVVDSEGGGTFKVTIYDPASNMATGYAGTVTLLAF